MDLVDAREWDKVDVVPGDAAVRAVAGRRGR